MRAFAILLLALCAAIPAVQAQTVPSGDGYVLRKTIPLQLDIDGVAGRLELLEDQRITPELRAEMWKHSRNPEFVLNPDDPLTQELQRKPLLPGKIRIVHAAGFVTFEETFEVPLGEIDTVKLQDSARRSFLVTVDYSNGFGSYTGPITAFAEIRGGDWVWIEAIDEDSGASSGISLMTSLKRGWKLVAGQTGKEVQRVGCEVDLTGDGPFKTEYGVYRFDGSDWRYRKRIEPGCFELDGEDSWPKPDAFP